MKAMLEIFYKTMIILSTLCAVKSGQSQSQEQTKRIQAGEMKML